jgi:hypothetical protein
MKLKGALVDQGAFQSVLEGNPRVKEWQIEISKAGGDPFEMDVVTVYAALAEEADEDAVRAEIDAGLVLETEVTPNQIEFLKLDDLVERLRTKGGMKELHVIDKRPDI